MKKRRGWRSAFGIFSVAAVAVCLSIQGASAERTRPADGGRAVKGAATGSPVASAEPAQAGQARKVTATKQAKPKAAASASPRAVRIDGSVRQSDPMWKPVGPEDLPGWPAKVEEFNASRRLNVQNPVQAGNAAGPGLGACCNEGTVTCFEGVSVGDCAAIGGVFFGAGTVCATSPCDCNQNGTLDADDITADPTIDCDSNGLPDACEDFPCKACCDASGNCIGDMAEADCLAITGATFNGSALCTQPNPGNLPLPVCNATECMWDNGTWLDDGGASRAHDHSGGIGQLGRYNFVTADDFMLPGTGTNPCLITAVRAWFRYRPATFPPQPPDGVFDIVTGPVEFNRGWNVNVFADIAGKKPGAHPLEPDGPEDNNALQVDSPGGLVYSRMFRMVGPGSGTEASLINICNVGNSLEANGPDPGDGSCTAQPMALCDPGVPGDFEDPFVYQIDITLDPPVVLKKNTKYWLAIQGVFPFNDGLRETLQTWWLLSKNNTGNRGRAYRTGSFTDWVKQGTNPAYNGNQDSCSTACPNGDGDCPGGSSCFTLLGDICPAGGASCVCNDVTPRAHTHFDHAFKLFGEKFAAAPNDNCASIGLSVPAFDGATPYDTTTATSAALGDGCSAAGPDKDIWFAYNATCTGTLSVSTCGSDYDTAITMYSAAALLCPVDGTNEMACNDDGTCGALGAGNGESVISALVQQGADYYIRVGGAAGASGAGILTIDCLPECGVTGSANCCEPVGPFPSTLGCEDADCCNAVCNANDALACCCGRGIACDPTIAGWDDINCAAAAGVLEVCQCPCALTCVGTAETEGCRADPSDDTTSTNGGCNDTPAVFDTIMCGDTICGTLSASGGSRDLDWYELVITSEMQIDIEFSGNIPVTVSVIDYAICRQGDSDCTDNDTGATCVDKNNVHTPLGCQNCHCDSGCGDSTVLDTFEIAGTASCRSNDNITSKDQSISTSLKPGKYAIVVASGELNQPNDDEDDFAGLFDGFDCGTQNDYRLALTCTTPVLGSCCNCDGTCQDGITESDCRLAFGNNFTPGGTCPDGTCPGEAHGCVNATDLGVVVSTKEMVDLTVQNNEPDPDSQGQVLSCYGGPGDAVGAMWYKFTVPTGTTSCLVATCNSVGSGRDSAVTVYEGGCCDAGPFTLLERRSPDDVPGGPIADRKRDCSDDDCGFTLFNSRILVEGLTGGEELYVQVINFDDTINGLYSLQIECPATGACCDAAAADCVEGATPEACLDPKTFSAGQTCAEANDPPCGQGACCDGTGTCSDATLATCVETGCDPATDPACGGCFLDTGGEIACNAPWSFQLGAVCANFDCFVPDGCDYDTGIFSRMPNDAASAGFTARYNPGTNTFTEFADDFTLKGTGDNVCLIDTIEYWTFHTGWDDGSQPGQSGQCSQGGGTGPDPCADLPTDYEAIHITISPDLPGLDKGPTCRPKTSPQVDGTHVLVADDTVACVDTRSPGNEPASHPPISIALCGDPQPANCPVTQLVGPEDTPPATGDWWEFIINTDGQQEYYLVLHLDPPLRLEKNKKYWLGIATQLQATNRYSPVWFLSNNYNGNDLQFFSTALETFDTTIASTNPNRDMLFKLTGTKEILGCGACQTHGDVFPFDVGNPNGAPVGNCVVDVDDVLTVLAAFSDADPCTNFPTTVNMFPCGGACNASDTDIDDILSVLAAFGSNFDCPHPCSPGACCLPDTTCLDGDNLGFGTTPIGGMSQASCNDLGGTYQGDGTVCAADNCP